eukprot:6047514-Pyramimonas_sp.AAC.1
MECKLVGGLSAPDHQTTEHKRMVCIDQLVHASQCMRRSTAITAIPIIIRPNLLSHHTAGESGRYCY